jgi:hypothetical protein
MAALGPREFEFLALLAARDVQLAAAQAASDARLAASQAASDARLTAAQAASVAQLAAANTAATAERDAARAAAAAQLAAARATAVVECDAARAASDAAQSASSFERIAALSERDAARAERDALRAAADAERALTRSVLARDATLEKALGALEERDAQRRRMALPNVRDALLGERLLDVLPFVSALGYAADVSHCHGLSGETWRRGNRGATNDMLVCSLDLQCGAVCARKAMREDFVLPWPGGQTIRGSTQLIRAVLLNNLPRVLQLVLVGTPLDLVDTAGFSALHWASFAGHLAIVTALLDGSYAGRRADVNLKTKSTGKTSAMLARERGFEGIVRLLLSRGANHPAAYPDSYEDFD